MVKGVSRRVVVVQPDNRALFEQAIFLVRDYDAPKREVLREACRIADRYLAGGARPGRRRVLPFAVAFALGVVGSSLIWTLAVFIL